MSKDKRHDTTPLCKDVFNNMLLNGFEFDYFNKECFVFKSHQFTVIIDMYICEVELIDLLETRIYTSITKLKKKFKTREALLKLVQHDIKDKIKECKK